MREVKKDNPVLNVIYLKTFKNVKVCQQNLVEIDKALNSSFLVY